jgi:hypothetical protein
VDVIVVSHQTKVGFFSPYAVSVMTVCRFFSLFAFAVTKASSLFEFSPPGRTELPQDREGHRSRPFGLYVSALDGNWKQKKPSSPNQ